ncbi:uncharacterized protein LOC141707443 [Apium graveolens]|uniref:uncharacterized protein LOC141707443 n=1 Tax=Apium graveolens TaxID=4045 RepID=UPI003D7B4F18
MNLNNNCFVQVGDVYKLYMENWRCMSDDILLKRRKLTGRQNLELSDDDLRNYTLGKKEYVLNSIGRSLKNYPTIPMPPSKFLDRSINKLVLEETSYYTKIIFKEHRQLVSNLNNEQKNVYEAVLNSVEKGEGGFFFVYGSGRCGKSYLWNTFITRLRLKIPLKLDEESSFSIPHNSDIAELINQTRLIIWDEVPMQNRFAFECLHCSLRDIMRSVNMDRSHVWADYQLHVLKENMRQRRGNSEVQRRHIKELSQWVLDIGDEKTPPKDDNNGPDMFKTINIPEETAFNQTTVM